MPRPLIAVILALAVHPRGVDGDILQQEQRKRRPQAHQGGMGRVHPVVVLRQCRIAGGQVQRLMTSPIGTRSK